MESVLAENSVETATTIAGHVAKKLIKRSRGGLIVPSKSLADFVCSNFAILDFVEADIAALSLPAKT